MKEQIAILLPTLKRLNDFIYFAESWKKTTRGLSKVIVLINQDDSTYDQIISNFSYPEFIYEKIAPQPFLKILNNAAIKYACEYEYLGFLEDDCAFISNNWEEEIIKTIKNNGPSSIVWGDDLLNHDKVVGVPFFSHQFIKKLGYMSPPAFNTQFVDVYWLQLGQKLNTLHYLPHVIIEHRHFISGKRKKDETSLKVSRECIGELEYYRSPEYQILLETDSNKLRL